jgi:hypothetical protein
MSKQYYSATDEGINLKKVEKAYGVQYETLVNSKKVADIKFTEESAYIERSTVQTFHALILSVVPRPIREVNPNFTSGQLRQTLLESCDKIDPNDANYDSSVFSETHDYGRVDAKQALKIVKEML